MLARLGVATRATGPCVGSWTGLVTELLHGVRGAPTCVQAVRRSPRVRGPGRRDIGWARRGSGTTRSALVGSAVRAQLAPSPPWDSSSARDTRSRSLKSISNARWSTGALAYHCHRFRPVGRPLQRGGARRRSLAHHSPCRHVEAEHSQQPSRWASLAPGPEKLAERFVRWQARHANVNHRPWWVLPFRVTTIAHARAVHCAVRRHFGRSGPFADAQPNTGRCETGVGNSSGRPSWEARGPFQYALSTRAGPEAVVRAARVAAETLLVRTTTSPGQACSTP